MFVKRNRTLINGRTYAATLLVQGERVPERRPPGRPPADAPPPPSRVVHRTLANLSKLPEPLIALVAQWCRDQRRPPPAPATGPAPPVRIGPVYGQLAALSAIAETLGIVQALGDSRPGRLALFLVLARVIHRGSRLSAVRWAQDQAVAEVLHLRPFNENALYAALDWVADHQVRIENALWARRPPAPSGLTVFLYDVTSSYLEGHHNELAAAGYNRDGKRYKKQLVQGLLTDDAGDPLSVQLYPGNTADPTTVGDQVAKVRDRFAAAEVVFVGDRGMVKSAGKDALRAAGLRYLTALTNPQIRTLLTRQVIQLGLFDEQPCEVLDGAKRYVLRCQPASRERDRARRADQLRRVQAKVTARTAYVATHPRASPEASLRKAARALKTYKLDRFVTPRREGRQVVLAIDEARRQDVELLDGCYVLETDLPAGTLDAPGLDARYRDLQHVERDFRLEKTGLLELRPVHLRKAHRTRGHAFVTMLALKVGRELDRRIAAAGLTVQDALDRLTGVRLVTLAEPALNLWQLPQHYEEPQAEVLRCLPPLPAPKLSLGFGRQGKGKTRLQRPQTAK